MKTYKECAVTTCDKGAVFVLTVGEGIHDVKYVCKAHVTAIPHTVKFGWKNPPKEVLL